MSEHFRILLPGGSSYFRGRGLPEEADEFRVYFLGVSPSDGVREGLPSWARLGRGSSRVYFLRVSPSDGVREGLLPWPRFTGFVSVLVQARKSRATLTALDTFR